MDTDRAPAERHPIGYWLRLVDRLIEENFRLALGGATVTPRHWQILNRLERGPATYAELDDEAAPFLAPHMPTVRPVVDDLCNRGWATPVGADQVGLTETGVKSLKDIQARVAEDRQRLTDGISQQEYDATMDVLARMAANLGWREEHGIGPI